MAEIMAKLLTVGAGTWRPPCGADINLHLLGRGDVPGKREEEQELLMVTGKAEGLRAAHLAARAEEDCYIGT
jgi:hypothetical protein